MSSLEQIVTKVTGSSCVSLYKWHFHICTRKVRSESLFSMHDDCVSIGEREEETQDAGEQEEKKRKAREDAEKREEKREEGIKC